MNKDYRQSYTPTAFNLKKKEKSLEVCFDDGSIFLFPAEFLRVHSPSAEVQGHSPDQKVVVSGRRHVGILSVELVGRYAVRIVFDDIHDTGIYSWDLLYALGTRQNILWEEYINELNALGLGRDP